MDVHLLAVLPDGSAVGYDDDKNNYWGVPTPVSYDQLQIKTEVHPAADSEDGSEWFERTSYLPDGSVFSHGITTRNGFERTVKIQAALDDHPVDQAALDSAWEAEKSTTQHQASPPVLTYAWTKKES